MDTKELMENVNEIKNLIAQSKILIGDIIYSICPITNIDNITISIETTNNIMKIKDLTNKAEKLMDNIKFNGQQESTGITNGIKIVNWTDGSWEDITKMLDAHYRGIINITDYWKTGNIRGVELSTGEMLYLTLIGNNHDDLANPINGITKAAFTVQTKNCLETKMRMFDSYDDPKFSSWANSDIRNYLNTEFYQNLPDELQSMIKTVMKVTYRYSYKPKFGPYYSESTTTKEAAFLLSEMEVYGTQSLGTESDWGRGEDGTQYEYYKTASNRIKYLGIDGTSAQSWWLRSSGVNGNGNSYFRGVDSNGDVDGTSADGASGVAVAFCI